MASCVPCIENCIKCSNSTTCDKCDSSIDFYRQADGSCLETCPDFNVANFDTGACQPCNDIFYFGECLTTCQSQTFEFTDSGTGQRSCIDCNSACAECIGPTTADCTSCSIGAFLHGAECLESCPEGYYEDDINSVCVQCSTNCEVCNAFGCQMCASGFFLDLTLICVTNCPVGFFENSISN